MKTRVVALLGAITILAAGCGGDGDGAGSGDTSALDELRDSGKLEIGFFNQQPFAYVDTDETLTGMEVEIVRECAERLDLPEPTGVQGEFEGLIPGLLADRFRMIASTMTWLPERAEVAAPSVPTYSVKVVAFLATGNPDEIHSVDDLNGVDYKVGAVIGTREYKLAQDELGKDRVSGFRSENEVLSALEANRIGAGLLPDFTGAIYLSANPDVALEPADPFEYPEIIKSAFWFRKDDSELREAFNGCLDEMKEDGTMGEILQQFNFPAGNVLPVGETFDDV